METSDFKLDEVEEKRRGGLYKLARALHLPRKMLEDAASWKRTRAAMITIITFVTVVPAAAVTISKKTTPTESIKVATDPNEEVRKNMEKVSDPRVRDFLLKSLDNAIKAGGTVTIRKAGDPGACGRVETEGDPDLVPGHPKLSLLLRGHRCFNFAWFENNGRTAVINYVIPYPGHPGPKDFDEARSNPLYSTFSSALNAELSGANELAKNVELDVIWRLIGKHTADWAEKLMAEQAKSSGMNLSDGEKEFFQDVAYWAEVRQVAAQEGLSVRLTTDTAEREAADKMPGDFLLPDGTADRYKLILARMSPSDWEKWQIVSGLAEEPLRNGNIEKGVAIYKQAFSYLKDPREIRVAIENIQRAPGDVGKRAIAELGLS